MGVCVNYWKFKGRERSGVKADNRLPSVETEGE